jgi:hypothetical protein
MAMAIVYRAFAFLSSVHQLPWHPETGPASSLAGQGSRSFMNRGADPYGSLKTCSRGNLIIEGITLDKALGTTPKIIADPQTFHVIVPPFSKHFCLTKMFHTLLFSFQFFFFFRLHCFSSPIIFSRFLIISSGLLITFFICSFLSQVIALQIVQKINQKLAWFMPAQQQLMDLVIAMQLL